jgi:hypothetical protein
VVRIGEQNPAPAVAKSGVCPYPRLMSLDRGKQHIVVTGLLDLCIKADYDRILRSRTLTILPNLVGLLASPLRITEVLNRFLQFCLLQNLVGSAWICWTSQMRTVWPARNASRDPSSFGYIGWSLSFLFPCFDAGPASGMRIPSQFPEPDISNSLAPPVGRRAVSDSCCNRKVTQGLRSPKSSFDSIARPPRSKPDWRNHPLVSNAGVTRRCMCAVTKFASGWRILSWRAFV